MKKADTDTYYIAVTFSRSLANDANVIADDGEVTPEQLLTQFALELQGTAYADEVAMDGGFSIHALNGAPLSDREKEAVMEGVKKAEEAPATSNV